MTTTNTNVLLYNKKLGWPIVLVLFAQMALTVKQALAGGKKQVTLCVTVCSVAVVIILQCAAEEGNKHEPSG